jgi:Xaa-Pro aminopeptidase
VIGLPSREQRRTYEVCMEIARMLEEALRPGVVACELWELKEREAKKAGFVRTQPFAGHGVGLSKHEPPHLAPWDRTVIQESMVVNLEPGLFAPPDACFTYEETYVIRADGLERITPLSSELYVA